MSKSESPTTTLRDDAHMPISLGVTLTAQTWSVAATTGRVWNPATSQVRLGSFNVSNYTNKRVTDIYLHAPYVRPHLNSNSRLGQADEDKWNRYGPHLYNSGFNTKGLV